MLAAILLVFSPLLVPDHFWRNVKFYLLTNKKIPKQLSAENLACPGSVDSVLRKMRKVERRIQTDMAGLKDYHSR